MESITELFCLVDVFCQIFEPEWENTFLPKPGKKKRDRACKLSLSELMTLVILFHLVGYRHLKGFYQRASDPLSKEFPGLPSYDFRCLDAKNCRSFGCSFGNAERKMHRSFHRRFDADCGM